MTKPVFILIAIFNLALFQGFGQAEEPIDSTRIKMINAAREIMNSNSTCALITVDPEGRPRVRQMDPFPPEDDFTVWFGTNPRSRKVGQIRNNPRVTLYYQETSGSGYVMICGTALLVDDKESKDKRWKKEWELFYPDKDKDYMLIKVTPDWLEVVSYSFGIIGDPVTWEPPVLTFNHEK